MPSALPMAIRQEIIRRRLDGQELCHIALELRVSYHSVRQIWRTFQQRGLDGMRHGISAAADPVVPDRSSRGPAN